MINKLVDKIKKQNAPVVVGLDPMMKFIPEHLKKAAFAEYGETLEGDDALKADCRIYQLSNKTGNGQITVYQVFNGIELYYNDMHMAYCNQDQVTVKNIIEINHCYIGRYECSFGENSCCYL